MVSRSRKTVAVEDIRKWVNKFLATDSTSPECRLACIELLEHFLFDTGNYKGFQYLEGVVRGGEVVPTRDDTRRYYH